MVKIMVNTGKLNTNPNIIILLEFPCRSIVLHCARIEKVHKYMDSATLQHWKCTSLTVLSLLLTSEENCRKIAYHDGKVKGV